MHEHVFAMRLCDDHVPLLIEGQLNCIFCWNGGAGHPCLIRGRLERLEPVEVIT
ncbi:hypothetical protein [Actinomadura rupiterrae]|uniref:hypothetical protein n=1 Tax=Actinomadura rupiterrae TaxID=559627 RepID=UPI0020A2E32B|nr:hypothetical protein [Actinomadura rupiterrae]MCP2339199.1 hypothetical protein [Actinomadura rupiterrae]